MAEYLIRVSRHPSDQRVRREPSSLFFYNEIDKYCEGYWEPNTDIYETETTVYIRLEVAGVSRDKISILVKNGKLIIAGFRQSADFDCSVRYHQMEVSCGEFSKVISLPESLEHNEISARLKDGILDIQISKTSEPVEIPILENNRKHQTEEE